jgi:hypothetical protein
MREIEKNRIFHSADDEKDAIIDGSAYNQVVFCGDHGGQHLEGHR